MLCALLHSTWLPPARRCVRDCKCIRRRQQGCSGAKVIRAHFCFAASAAQPEGNHPFFPVHISRTGSRIMRAISTLLYVMRWVGVFSRVPGQRVPRNVISSFKPHTSPLPGRLHRQSQWTSQFASSRRSMSSRSQDMEESLRNLDINAAEQFSKDWFGDHANWDHEKLLALFYGMLALRLQKPPCSRTQWRILCPLDTFATLESMPSVGFVLVAVNHRTHY
jgi:hypothetical protein